MRQHLNFLMILMIPRNLRNLKILRSQRYQTNLRTLKSLRIPWSETVYMRGMTRGCLGIWWTAEHQSSLSQ